MSAVGGAAPQEDRVHLMPDPPETLESGNGELAGPTRPSSMWSRVLGRVSRPQPPPVSDYEVLIHGGTQRFGTNTIRLSDPRLKPRLPIWLVLSLVLLFVAVILCVFFLVPRGMGFGTAKFNVTTIYLKKTQNTYTLIMDVHIIIYNNNYVDAFLSGNVTMRFYKVIAGSSAVGRTRIARRARSQEINVVVDASNVPFNYITTVLENCDVFPHELVFFLEGQFEGHYLGQRQNLTLDTYTFVNCPNWEPENALEGNENALMGLS